MEALLPSIGKNIRLFRRSRNWTLADLASRVGIQEGPLGRIERGANLPSAAVLHRLSIVLGVSLDALFSPETCQAPVVSPEVSDIRMITVQAEGPPPRRSLLEACHAVMKAFHGLEDICRAQKYALLPLSIPFDPSYPGMDRLAVQVRQYLGAGDIVVFDYFELLETMGLRIVVFPFPRDARDTDAACFYEPVNNNAFFFINSQLTPEKQLFALSRELGKIIVSNRQRLHTGPLFPPAEAAGGDRRPINAERAAKRFAATFLMPEAAVKSTVSQLGIVDGGWTLDLLFRIKHRFGVSAEAFLYRLDELGLIDKKLVSAFKARIHEFYSATNYQEPDSTRRHLTPNGRFLDLMLTAERVEDDQDEIVQIKEISEHYGLLR
jgi:Zn-dependent peptidase ImmA (M78 family)/transcriptional regulator with XRE-family HTH domain